MKLHLVFVLLLFSSISVLGQKPRNVSAKQFATVITIQSNIRYSPSNEGSVIRKVSKGQKLELVSAENLNGWYQVKLGAKQGWIHGNNIQASISQSLKPKSSIPFVVSGQDTEGGYSGGDNTPIFQSPPANEPEGWKLLTSTKKNIKGFYYYWHPSRYTYSSDKSTVTLWLKQVPMSQKYFKPNLRFYSHTMQKIYLSCTNQTISFQDSIDYSVVGEMLDSASGIYASHSIVPESVGEGIYNFFCKAN